MQALDNATLAAMTDEEIEDVLRQVATLQGADWLRNDPEAQALERVKEIRTQMGGDPSPFAPPPFAPGGMSHLEYQRLLDEMVGATTRALMISQKRAGEGDIAGCWLSLRLWIDARRALKGKPNGDQQAA